MPGPQCGNQMSQNMLLKRSHNVLYVLGRFHIEKPLAITRVPLASSWVRSLYVEGQSVPARKRLLFTLPRSC